jgi:hypothetical protein
MKSESLLFFVLELFDIMNMNDTVEGGSDDVVKVGVVFYLGYHRLMHQLHYLLYSDFVLLKGYHFLFSLGQSQLLLRLFLSLLVLYSILI